MVVEIAVKVSFVDFEIGNLQGRGILRNSTKLGKCGGTLLVRNFE